jgi:antitoxin MazE
MRGIVRRVGNSSGVITPKSMLEEIGIAVGDAVDLSLGDGRILLAPLPRRARDGWAEASRQLAETALDALVWPEFGNTGDKALGW